MEVYTRDPTSPDGIYPMVNGGHSYNAYCDITRGGWELVARVGSTSQDFLFASPLWTNEETLNAEDLDGSSGHFSVAVDRDGK